VRWFLVPLPLVTALALAACAGAPPRPPPPPLTVGQTVAEAATVQETEFSAALFQFTTGTTAMALYGADADGRAIPWSPTMAKAQQALVFEDGCYLGTLEFAQAIDLPECLLHADGPALLAVRLRALTAGDSDPLQALVPEGENLLSKATTGCPRLFPPKFVEPQEDPSPSQRSSMGQTAVDIGATTVALVLSPIVVPLGLGYVGIANSLEKAALQAQRALTLGMAEQAVLDLLGKPDAAFDEKNSGTQVLRYKRRLTPDLWIGLRGGRVTWSRATGTAEVLETWAGQVAAGAPGEAPAAADPQSLNDTLMP
jgi:hypothetical protein